MPYPVTYRNKAGALGAPASPVRRGSQTGRQNAAQFRDISNTRKQSNAVRNILEFGRKGVGTAIQTGAGRRMLVRSVFRRVITRNAVGITFDVLEWILEKRGQGTVTNPEEPPFVLTEPGWNRISFDPESYYTGFGYEFEGKSGPVVGLLEVAPGVWTGPGSNDYAENHAEFATGVYGPLLNDYGTFKAWTYLNSKTVIGLETSAPEETRGVSYLTDGWEYFSEVPPIPRPGDVTGDVWVQVPRTLRVREVTYTSRTNDTSEEHWTERGPVRERERERDPEAEERAEQDRRHKRRPAGAREKERKVISNLHPGSALAKIVNAVTETDDFVTALWEALPPESKSGYYKIHVNPRKIVDGHIRTKSGKLIPVTADYTSGGGGATIWVRRRFAPPQQKVSDLYRGINKIDINQAVKNVAINQIEDAVFGGLSARAQREARGSLELLGRNRGFGTGPAL